MTKPIKPTDEQHSDLQKILAVLNERTGRRVETTLDILQNMGYTPAWRRVVWTGGVGSYKWMPRRRKLRILVAATKSGLTMPKIRKVSYYPGVVTFEQSAPKRKGFRYGWCVEC